MNHQIGLKLILAISKQQIFRCLIGTKVRGAHDATVKDYKNSAQGTEKEEDSPGEEQTIFSDLTKNLVSSHLLLHTNKWNQMHYKLQ
jgi:hypothetical protein